MVASSRMEFTTLNTSVKYGEQKFRARGTKIALFPSQRQRVFRRGREFNIAEPFTAHLSISPHGMKLFEEVTSFAVSPQIADWLVALAPGKRQDGRIKIGMKGNLHAFIFSIKKEKDRNWSVSLFEDNPVENLARFNVRMATELTHLDSELKAEVERIDKDPESKQTSPDRILGKELARLHGFVEDLTRISVYAEKGR